MTTKLVSTGVEFPDATTQTSKGVKVSGDTMTGDLSLGDNVKAKFGASDDLQIFHEATGNSRIVESGTGHLNIEAANLNLKTPSGENYINCNENGNVGLRYDNVEKLATTSTGIDVTGSVTCDGFTSTGIDDNATSTAMTIDSNENITMNGVSPQMIVGSNAVSTGTCAVQIGANRTGNGNSYVDLVGDATYTDYGLRIIRSSGGANTASELDHRGTGALVINARDAGYLSFRTQNSERFRVTSAGDVDFGGAYSDGTYSARMGHGGTGGQYLHCSTGVTAAAWQIRFVNPNGTVGNILTSGTSTSYNTSSDYRLKENVVPMTGSIDRLKALKPSRFNFIADADTTVDGFLAHEAGEVVPECASGEKDAMTTEEYEVTPAVMDGDTVVTEAVMGEREVEDYQGIDQSKLVPLLVSALQEAVARIEQLENA